MGDIRFDGQVILITGGARGIGRAHAELLAERGASLLISDVGLGLYGDGADTILAEQAVREIRAKGGIAEAHHGDLMDEQQARGAVRGAITQYGRIDATAGGWTGTAANAR